MFSLTIEDSNGQVAERFSFDHGSYLIGRQESCDIVLPSSSVSRRHAKLFVEDGRCYVEDLDSANGVTVDGQRVVEQRHLGTASQVRVGNYYLYLEYQGNEQLEDQDIRQTLFISDDPDHNKLVRINDEFAGEEFSLSEIRNTIGRTDDNFILLSDPSISREHAVIHRDDDQYVLSDMGSSNGTRVNGQEITEPTTLEAGDIVEFGNVEFVFVPGEQEVDPSEYSGFNTSPNTFLLASVVTVVLLVGVVAGGLIVFGFWSIRTDRSPKPNPKPSSTTSVEAEIEPVLERGRTHLRKREWDRAIEAFNEVLAHAPNHDAAKRLRQRARREKEAEAHLIQGESYSEHGKHEKALKVLRKIPKGTDVYDRAEPTLAHVRKTIAFNLRNESDQLLRSEEQAKLKEAREKLLRAEQLDPTNDKTEEMLDEVEDRMTELGYEYQPAP